MEKLGDIATGSFVGGAFHPGALFEVLDKYRLTPIAQVGAADSVLVDQALIAATAYGTRLPSAYTRAEILLRVRDLVSQRRTLFQQVMTTEAGFPVADANGEIDRALQTLTLSAEEAKRLTGEVVPFDGAPGGSGRIGLTLRLPLGLVVAITPFNAPLNTVCHKVGPAFAGGNAVILKPSEKTPLTANLLATCFAEAGAPDGSFAVLQGGAEVAGVLLDDPRPNFFAFTGSTRVGAAIQARAGLRRTQMELGSIAATIVLDDADLDMAAAKCAAASFRKAGQVCTSIQMLLVQTRAMPSFREAFMARATPLVAGDPSDPSTDVGPLISVEAAYRVEEMLKGESFLLSGRRDGAVIPPTVVDNPDLQARVLTEEIFGPVVCLMPVPDLDTAMAHVNSTPFGLATGVFTGSLASAFQAAQGLRVGGVHINETCSSRVDLMPYGGAKASGFGHEGPKYAIREMMEERLVTFSGLA